MVNFLNEENYKIEFEKIALPYLNKRRTNSYFNGSCGNLFYSFFKADKERGRVIIIHGYTESTEKYLLLQFLRLSVPKVVGKMSCLRGVEYLCGRSGDTLRKERRTTQLFPRG